ncbi:hypothetical protein PCASD_23127, partial [Puccinia coronata f. sp. avenae]
MLWQDWAMGHLLQQGGTGSPVRFPVIGLDHLCHKSTAAVCHSLSPGEPTGCGALLQLETQSNALLSGATDVSSRFLRDM